MLEKLRFTRYLELLRTIAVSWRSVKKDKSILKDIKNAKCLLAYREINVRASKSNDNDYDDSGDKSWELVSADQVVIVDDIITYNQFKTKLLAAPMEESLEDFYHSLGSPEVSSLLEETQSIGMIAKNETLAIHLQKLIQERSRLFLYGYPRESVKHDAKWIEQNLKVKCVESIKLRKTLRGYNLSHTETRTAVLNPDKAILYVASSGYDMFEVSQALAPVLLHRSKPEALFMLEMILESSLQKLRSRGYNVSRLLNQRETEARIAEDARKKQLKEEQREREEREERESQARKAKQHPAMPDPVKEQREREKHSAAWKAELAKEAVKLYSLPGLYPESPENRGQNPDQEEPVLPPQPRGFLNGWGKHFGFDRRPSSRVPDFASGSNADIEHPGMDAPPPYQQDVGSSQTRPREPEAVTAPRHLQQK